MPEQHSILGGKVYVYQRPNSSLWQCSTYFAGKNRRVSTKEESLSKAKEFAEDWYLELRGKLRNGEIKTEKTFREASEQYLREYDIMTQGQRSKAYVEDQHGRSRLHLVPFFGNLGLSEITPGKIQKYRIHRHKEAMAKWGKPPARNTLHQEFVILRQTLKHGGAPWMAGAPSRSVRAIPLIAQNLPPGVVLSRRVQTTVRGHEKASTQAKAGALPMGIGAAPRLCATGRGMAASIP